MLIYKNNLLPWILGLFFIHQIQADWFADEIHKNISREASNLNQQIYINSHNECKSKKWSCQRECRLQFFEDTGSCKVPRGDEYCFGSKITYNYTWNQSVKHFPKEFELIKRFPKCWSYLGPLICSTIYRPCSKNSFMEASRKEPGFVELWQIFPQSLCQQAKNECSFLTALGIWPDYLNCQNTALLQSNYPIHETVEQEQRLFTNSSSCKMRNDLEAKFVSEQCLWPLIKGSNHLQASKKAAYLMDSCYMPCQTPVAGFEWVIDSFRKRNSVIAGLSLVVFAGITTYLIIFSKIYHTSLSIFCLTQGFISITIYLITWTLTMFDDVYEAVMCIDNGRIRKNSLLESLDLCTVETIIGLYTLLAASLWMTLVLLIKIIKPKIRNDNYFMVGSRNNEISARTLLITLIYLILPVVLSLIAGFTWQKPPMDALSGLCHVTAGTFEQWIIIYVTQAGLLTTICLAYLAVAIQKKIQKTRLESSLERGRRPKASARKLISSIEMDKNEAQNIKDEVIHNERNSTKVDSYVLEHGLGDGLIPGYWLAAVFGTILFGFCVNGALQYDVLHGAIGEAAERDMITESIRCSIESTISDNLPDWWNSTINADHLTTISDPYLRKEALFNSINAPGCDLSMVKESTLLSLFVSTIILPCLPYWVAAVCFFAGFCGTGIKSVNKVRNRYNPFVKDGQKKKVGFAKADEYKHFLQSDNDEKNPIIEEVEMESQSQATAPTGVSAPARLQSDVIAEDEDVGLPSLLDNESTAVVGAGSVHSEPTTSFHKHNRSKKIDLKRKFQNYRRDRIFKEQLDNAISNGSYISQFTDDFGQGDESECNFTSISERVIPMNQFIRNDATINELMGKYDEVKHQNQQLMMASYNTMRVLDSLNCSYSEMKNSFHVLANKVQADQEKQAVNFDHVKDIGGVVCLAVGDENEAKIAKISPLEYKKAYSSTSDSSVNQKQRMSPKRRLPVMKIRIEGKAKKAVTQTMMELPSMNRTSRDMGDTSEDDEVPDVPEWSLPNPPLEIQNFRNSLMLGHFAVEVVLPPEDEMHHNLFYRLVSHCTSWLPEHMRKVFVHYAERSFEEYYLEDDSKSSIFAREKIYPDTEAIEAASEEPLQDFCWPLICKAIYKAGEMLYIDVDRFCNGTSDWILTEAELMRFSTLLSEGELSSVPEELGTDGEEDDDSDLDML